MEIIQKHILPFWQKLSSEGTTGTLLKGAGSAAAVNIAGLGTMFLVQILLARILNITQYGIYALVLSWMGLLVLPATGGFDAAMVRYVATYHSKQEWAALRGLLTRASQIVSLLSLLVAGAAAVAVLLMGSQIGAELRTVFLIGCAGLPFAALLKLREGTLRGLKRIASAVLPGNVLRPILIGLLCGGTYLLFEPNLSAADIMLLQVVAAGLALVAANWLIFRTTHSKVKDVSPTFSTWRWSGTAYSLMFISGIYLTFGQFDSIMIGILRPVNEVGAYSVAARVSTLIMFGHQAIGLIAAPMISESYAAKDQPRLQQLVSKISIMTAWASVPLFVGVLALGPWILALFGSEFQIAYPALALLALGQLSIAFVGPSSFLFTMTDHQGEGLRILACSLGINIILNLPAIYYFGMYGAALATGFSFALSNLWLWRRARQLLNVDASIFSVMKRS